jgi:hypothetical protein
MLSLVCLLPPILPLSIGWLGQFFNSAPRSHNIPPEKQKHHCDIDTLTSRLGLSSNNNNNENHQHISFITHKVNQDTRQKSNIQEALTIKRTNNLDGL